MLLAGSIGQAGGPVLVEAGVVRGESGEDGAAEFEDVEGAELFVKDLAVGIEEDGIGDGGIPLGIESALERLCVGGIEQEIASSGMEMAEHAEDAVAFIGLIDGHGDVIDVANTVHAESFFEVGELVDTGAAPGGPEIDKCVLLEGIGAKSLEAVRGDGRDFDGLRIEFADDGDAINGFLGPLGGTAERAGVGDGRIFVGQEGVDGVAGVLRFDLFNAVGVVEAAFVAQVPSGIEDENVRRGLRAIGTSSGLGFAVVEIRISEVLPGHPDFHILERVRGVGGIQFIDAEGLGIVGLDDHDGDTFGGVVVVELLDALLVHLGDGAVVAGEDDGEDRAGGVVREGVCFAVDAGKRKIRGREADGEDRVVDESGLGGGEDGSKKEKQEADGFHRALDGCRNRLRESGRWRKRKRSTGQWFVPGASGLLPAYKLEATRKK
jgi:hypothetical protein